MLFRSLLLEGQADNLAAKQNIRNTLQFCGAEHYVKARERGYVLYVEGSTDLDMLRALADRLNHPVASKWDERVNAYYVQNTYPDQSLESELERVEGGFGVAPKDHFFPLRQLISDLRGVGILDNDGRNRQGFEKGGLSVVYWRRYEAENYFITPDVLRKFTKGHYYKGADLFSDAFSEDIDKVLDQLILERVFDDAKDDFLTYNNSTPEAARLIWNSKTERIKLSDFAEEFFRRLAQHLGHAMLLRKGELHRLVAYVEPASIPAEVSEKLDLLLEIFQLAQKSNEL